MACRWSRWTTSAKRAHLPSVLRHDSEMYRPNSRITRLAYFALAQGELEGKAAEIFVSTSSLHGGQEATILSLIAPMLHRGMILVGVPYSTQELFTTQGGGSPYGPGHVAGGDNKRQIDEQERPSVALWAVVSG